MECEVAVVVREVEARHDGEGLRVAQEGGLIDVLGMCFAACFLDAIVLFVVQVA